MYDFQIGLLYVQYLYMYIHHFLWLLTGAFLSLAIPGLLLRELYMSIANIWWQVYDLPVGVSLWPPWILFIIPAKWSTNSASFSLLPSKNKKLFLIYRFIGIELWVICIQSCQKSRTTINWFAVPINGHQFPFIYIINWKKNSGKVVIYPSYMFPSFFLNSFEASIIYE